MTPPHITPGGPDRRRDIGVTVRAVLMSIHAYAFGYALSAGTAPGTLRFLAVVEFAATLGTYIGIRFGHVSARWWPLVAPPCAVALALVIVHLVQP